VTKTEAPPLLVCVTMDSMKPMMLVMNVHITVLPVPPPPTVPPVLETESMPQTVTVMMDIMMMVLVKTVNFVPKNVLHVPTLKPVPVVLPEDPTPQLVNVLMELMKTKTEIVRIVLTNVWLVLI